MAVRNATEVNFNTVYFDQILKSAGVSELTKAAAENAAVIAKTTAPEDQGDYKAGIGVEQRMSRYRIVWRVVGRDKKTMLIEAMIGHLARSLKAAGRG